MAQSGAMATLRHPRRETARSRETAVAALWRDRSGTAMLEFALVGPAFIALLSGIFYVSLAFLSQEGLETAAEGAGRLFQTGLAQTATVGTDKGMSATDFRNAVCNGVSATTAAGATITIQSMLPPFMTCANVTTNVVVQPAGSTFSGAMLATPTYNCYGTACNSASSSTTATTATSSAIAGSQNRIVVVQLFYNWNTVSSLFGLNGLTLTSKNGQMTMAATAVVTAEAYTCSASQTSC